MYGRNRSMGTGRITVELFSEDISPNVWKSLSCKAVGLSSLSAACLRRWEAWYSPSAAMIFARRSRSLSACLAVARPPWVPRAPPPPAGRLPEALGGLVLPLGRYDLRPTLPLALGLPGHRPLHLLGYLDVLDLHDGDLHPPGVRVVVDYGLELLVYGLSVG